MSTQTQPTVSQRDTEILRALGARIADAANSPQMAERRRLWRKLNALEAERPMVLTETGGVLDQVIPLSSLHCEGEWARGVERGLLDRLFHFEEIDDDLIFWPRMTYRNVVNISDYGVPYEAHRGDDGAGHGSYVWESPLQRLPEDLDKLSPRTFTFDAEATDAQRVILEAVFTGVLPVEKRATYWWTVGMTWPAIRLVGLEGFMMAMYDQPEGLHALMAFLRDDHQRMLDWYETNGILSPNNEDDYIGSGGGGCTDRLPQSDWQPGQPARIKDLWGLSESQETVSVSPEMFEEFVFPYQLPVISRFGFACYGCCEPVDVRWHIIKRIPNLRRVSVSPWSNVETMAGNLGKNYVFSRKPNPAYISTKWEEDVVREDLRRTLEATNGLNVELVLKDVHTVSNEPWRFRRWVQIAREEIAKIYG
ncbi:MAG TPA: hypothetical protein VGM23_01460 [Armatimonadota bacterium]